MRTTPNASLQRLHLTLVGRLLQAGAISGEIVALDSCPVPAPVRQNNLKTSVKDRFNKERFPTNDPQARLGVYRSYASPTRSIAYFWGYRNHVAVDFHSKLPLLEQTHPANQHENRFAIPLLAACNQQLSLPLRVVCADSAYDTEKILAFIIQQLGAQPVIAPNARYQPNSDFRVQGQNVICPANLEMAPRGRMTPKKTGITQHIGEGSHQEPELIGLKGVGGGAIGEQVELLLLDAVFHLPAGTVDLLVEGLSRVGFSRQGGNDETGVGAAGQDLGLGDHTALAGPALLGAVGEVGEEPNRLLLLVEEGLGFVYLGGDGVLETGVSGQAEQIVHLMLLTPPHQLFSGKSGVGPQQDLDLRPDPPQAGDDALDLLQSAGIGSDGTAVEISHHAAAAVGFKLQGFGVTLCWHRFSFKDLVNSFGKSILTDSENRCFLPLVRNSGYAREFPHKRIWGEES